MGPRHSTRTRTRTRTHCYLTMENGRHPELITVIVIGHWVVEGRIRHLE